MAKIKYFFSPFQKDNASFLDSLLQYGTITTAGQEFEVVGTSRIDTVFVRPDSDYNLTQLGGSVDKIYLAGPSSNYTFAAVGSNLELTNSTTNKKVTIAVPTSSSDRLFFENGFISARGLYSSAQAGINSISLDPSDNSQSAPAAATPTASLDGALKAVMSGTGGGTVATVRPGIELTVTGTAGVDNVYVADG